MITAALRQVKSPYEFPAVHPNRIMQSLVAILAGMGVPFLCTETHELAVEVVASYLYQVHLYHWLGCAKANAHGSRRSAWLQLVGDRVKSRSSPVLEHSTSSDPHHIQFLLRRCKIARKLDKFLKRTRVHRETASAVIPPGRL